MGRACLVANECEQLEDGGVAMCDSGASGLCKLYYTHPLGKPCQFAYDCAPGLICDQYEQTCQTPPVDVNDITDCDDCGALDDNYACRCDFTTNSSGNNYYCTVLALKR